MESQHTPGGFYGFAAGLLCALFVIGMFIPMKAHAATVVFLTSGTSYAIPADWNNSMNSIEVIGGGAGGAGNGGGGGGGGAYSKAVNVTLSGTVGYAVGAGGGSNTSGGDTYFCNSTSNCASIAGTAVVAGAKGGVSSGTTAGGAGGASASGVGSTKYSGGNGGGDADVYRAGAGGGAAGKNGAGNDATGAGVGGSGDAGSGGAGGAAGTNGTNAVAGSAGTEWDATHGSGGGGGAGYIDGNNSLSGVGGAGGAYGAGGGGGGGDGISSASTSGGAGSQGLIVISYTPYGVHSTVTLTKSSTVTGGAAVFGTISKGSGTFVIDHPLDPKNKLLYHSFVESPDVKNIYDGIATLDDSGNVTIELPRYFLPLNKDFRYLGTAIGQPMPDRYLSTGIRKRFWIFGAPILKIAGGVPNGKVSWQVTGIRHDVFIRENPINVIVDKGPDALVDKGEYLFPELYAK